MVALAARLLLVTAQTPFGFASGKAPGQVLFHFSDSDGIDRYVYDLGVMRLWHDWWFVGARAAAEYLIRRGDDGLWQVQLHAWQENTAEPVSDLAFNGHGQWHPAATLPKEAGSHDIHRRLCEWHAVQERHIGELEKAYQAACGSR